MAADVKIFAPDIEEQAQVQVESLARMTPFDGAHIRIMPDAHAGKGCVIGFTANVTDAVIPNVVGVDIGCGLLAVKLDAEAGEALARTLDAAAHRAIPTGFAVHDKTQLDSDVFDELACAHGLTGMSRLVRALGTLGGGNHFIECDVDPEGNPWLVIHTGSRNLGTQVASFYQVEAIAQRKAALHTTRDALVERWRAEGRQSEIAALLAHHKRTEVPVPNEVCWLEGDARDAYLHDMDICQNFAQENRERIAELLLDAAGIEPAGEVVSSVHNYIDLEHGITRKGAIAAYAGQRLIIPLNMAAGCVIGKGLGNEDWNCSAPHGAGRRMSRGQAHRELAMDDYRASMAGIFSTSICETTIDEAPAAYKDPEGIVAALAPTVHVDFVMRPIWNFKDATGNGRQHR